MRSVSQLEDVELDLEAGDVVVARRGEARERGAIDVPGGVGHGPAVGEIDVGQQPAGLARPRQHAEGRRVGEHQHVAGALERLEAEAAAGRPHRKHRAVGGVLGEQRAGDAAAVVERVGRLAGDQRLAAQQPVLIGKRRCGRPRAPAPRISRRARSAASFCSSDQGAKRSTKVIGRGPAHGAPAAAGHCAPLAPPAIGVGGVGRHRVGGS